MATKYEKKTKGKQGNAKYAAMVESVDDTMGKIVNKLEELKLTHNTLIIFTSDNGGLAKVTNNHPLRSGKGYPYEGGIRVPFIAKWPGRLPKGFVSDEPVISMDIYPTLAAAAKLDISHQRNIDGLDFIPAVQQGKSIGRDTLFWHFPHYRHSLGPYSIIRNGDWKMIKWYEGPISLFNLKHDPSESVDLAAAMPEKVSELEYKIEQHLRQTTDRVPHPNPDYVSK